MASKHTPGPWEVKEHDREEYWCGYVHYNAGPAVGIGKIEDARLIAAAPELLAALKTAAEVIGHPDDSFSVYMARLIAKATGEE